MAKLLKPMIILVFVLSIAALALGFMLFSQRETIKGRIVKLEQTAQEVASNLNYDNLNAQMLQDYAAMDGQLRGLEKAAESRYDELQETKTSLEQTQEELASTQTTLEQSRTDLASAREQIEDLEGESRRQRADIAQKTRNIDTLERDTARYTNQVAQLQLNLEIAQQQLEERESEYNDLMKEYTQIVRSIEGDTGPQVDLDPDLMGRVLVTRPEWNFVVIDLGRNEGLQEEVQLLVHRGRELVGRVRITEVTDTLSIGEMMDEWQLMPVTSGDFVIPPGS